MKNKLLSFHSPKYTPLWFIPIFDLQCAVPQNPSDNNTDASGKFSIRIRI
jgi:hypothetical protein